MGILQNTNPISFVGEWLEKYDISGLTSIFLIFFTIINVSVLLYCCYKGKISLENEWNYESNKKLVIIFLILAIMAFLCFIGIRAEEESLAEKLDDDIVEVFEEGYYTLSTSTKIEELVTKDLFYSRKLEIRKEIQSTPEIYRYLDKFVYIPIGWVTMEEAYYSIFSNFTWINLIMRRILLYTYW